MQNNNTIKTCSCCNGTNGMTGSNYNGPFGMTGSNYNGPIGMSGSSYNEPIGMSGSSYKATVSMTDSSSYQLNPTFGMSGSSYNGPIGMSGSSYNGPIGMSGSNHTSLVGSYISSGLSGTNYTFIPTQIPNNFIPVYYDSKGNVEVSGLTGSYKINAHYMDSSNNILKSIIKQDETYYLTKNNMYNKKLNLDKEICEYLNLKKNCSIADLKNSLDKISLQNKEYLLSHSILFKNKENIPNKKSVIFLDNEGKKVFNLKSNLIDVNCLLDLIIFNFMDKVPESHFYDHNKAPKEISELSV